MIQNLVVNEEIKNFVRKPLGSLIKEKDLRANFKGNVIAIGDRVTLTCEKLNLKPRVAVIDYRIMRKKISAKEKKQLQKFGTWTLRAKNHAGTISLEAWNKVRQALDEFPEEIVKIEIEGEEDLLTLAAILNAESGDRVIYGQPKKGIVVVEVSEKKKREISDMLIQEKAREFLSRFKGTTVIVHDSDPDGVSSAVMFTRYLQNRKNKVLQRVSTGATIPLYLKDEIKKLNAKNLVVLDLGGEARNTIKELSAIMNVLIVDHHKIFLNDRKRSLRVASLRSKETEELCSSGKQQVSPDFGKALYLNPHFFNVPDDYISTTSFLSWQICRNSDWLAAAGIIADKGFLPAAEFLKKVRKKYAKVNFNYLVDLLNAADAKGKASDSVQILLKAKKPQELFKSRLVEWEKEVRKEISRLVAEHKEKALFIANGKIVLYEIKPKFALRGEIANRLQQLYPDKIIIIGEIENSHYLMSFRTVKANVSFPDLIKKVIENFEGAHGGGHAKAAGCKVRLEDKEKFLQRFLESLK